jgi:hypothetical protein
MKSNLNINSIVSIPFQKEYWLITTNGQNPIIEPFYTNKKLRKLKYKKLEL